MTPRPPEEDPAPPSAGGPGAAPPFGPRVLGLFGLARSRWAILGLTLLGGGLGAVLGAAELDAYTSRAKLRYLPGARQQLTDEAAVGFEIQINLRRAASAMDEEVLLLRDPLVYGRVVDTLGAAEVLRAADPMAGVGPGTGVVERCLRAVQAWSIRLRGLDDPCPAGETPGARQEAVDALLERTTIAVSGETETIDVVYRDTSPERAERILGELVEEMLGRHLEVFEVESDVALLQASKADTYRRLQRASRELLAFQEQCQVFDLAEERLANHERIRGAEALEGALARDRQRLLGLIGALEVELGLRGVPDGDDSGGIINPAWLALQTDIAEVDGKIRRIDLIPSPGEFSLRRRARLLEERAKLEEVLERTGRRGAGSGLMMLDEDADLARTNTQSMLSAAKADLEGVLAQLVTVRRQLEEARERRRAIEECAVEHVRLRREVDLARDRYRALTQNERELSFIASMEAEGRSNLILSRPPSRARAGPPGRGKSLYVGIAASLSLGVGLAVLRQLLDPRVRHRETVEDQLGIPLLCAVPVVKRKTRFRGARGVA